jgi:hypothetical protein
VAGAVEIEALRVNDRRVDEQTGEKTQFRSVIIPPWCRRSPKVTEVLPLCTCTDSRQATSSRPSRGSSVLQPGCRLL